ncbi:hypothetical protein [Phaeospirillum tilakii]|uniref:Uncharacterized protein n=1 Tax=Phaeospirillum tilakii TaxID=741673 RepID=A0ABW5CFE0_9PROT
MATELPAKGYFTNDKRNVGEAKQAQDDMLEALRETRAAVGEIGGAVGAVRVSPADTTPATLSAKIGVAGPLTANVTTVEGVGEVLILGLSASTLITGRETVTAGEEIAALATIYCDTFGQRGPVGRWYAIDTDATNPVRCSPVRGIALAAISAGQIGAAQVGPGPVSGFVGLTPGAPVWASAVVGGVTQTEPAVPASGAQNVSVCLGRAISATTIAFEPWHAAVFQARNSALAVGAAVTVEHWVDAGAREREARAYLVASSGYQKLIGGTPIGGYNYGSRRSAAFDGVTSQGGASGAQSNNINPDSIGLSFSSPQPLHRVVLYAPTDVGYDPNSSNATIKVQGSNDGFATQTDLYTSAGRTDTNTAGVVITIDSSSGLSTGTPYLAYRVSEQGTTSGRNAYWAEVEFYAAVSARDEPLVIGSETINAVATDRVTVKFADASDGNAATKTTFTNRTGATRDLVVEVSL